MKHYVTGSAPHIRSQESATTIYWLFLAALIPCIFISVLLFGWKAVFILGCAVSAAILAEVVGGYFFKEQAQLENGHTIFMGILFGLLCSVTMPLWMVGLGSFVGILIGKQIFGGIGQYPFHPVLVGHLFLFLNFPYVVPDLLIDFSSSTQGTLQFKNFIWMKDTPFIGGGSFLIVCLCGLFLAAKKMVSWTMPAAYLFMISLAGIFIYPPTLLHLNSGVGALVAFFILTDGATHPISPKGKFVFAVGAACLVVVFQKLTNQFYVYPFVILIMNTLVPWLDVYERPTQGGVSHA